MSKKSKNWKVTDRTAHPDIPIYTRFGVRVGTSTCTVRSKDMGQREHVTVSYSEDRSKELDRLGDKISRGKFDKK